RLRAAAATHPAGAFLRRRSLGRARSLVRADLSPDGESRLPLFREPLPKERVGPLGLPAALEGSRGSPGPRRHRSLRSSLAHAEIRLASPLLAVRPGGSPGSPRRAREAAGLEDPPRRRRRLLALRADLAQGPAVPDARAASRLARRRSDPRR